MITLDKILSDVNPDILKELNICQVDYIIQHGLVLYLHRKGKDYFAKDFWNELNPDNKPGDKVTILNHAENRLFREFMEKYAFEDGGINWRKLNRDKNLQR
ncbi:MAG TPA: hypothetical protein ACFYD2_05230 [Candidatus Avalokitesvara rifleensis]|uniref:hypothetical protein n=1 Tax=Candidatus Avalokitesvara rifleensis TaxID=3367620 RepID=UPI0027142FB4|nr:hypothetical protein [Candidatus Brocadiales bacterium]